MSGFHRYRVDWTPACIRGYIDDAQVFAFANAGSGPDAWPFDRRFHLLLNLAVGGDWRRHWGAAPKTLPPSFRAANVRLTWGAAHDSLMSRPPCPGTSGPPITPRAATRPKPADARQQ